MVHVIPIYIRAGLVVGIPGSMHIIYRLLSTEQTYILYSCNNSNCAYSFDFQGVADE